MKFHIQLENVILITKLGLHKIMPALGYNVAACVGHTSASHMFYVVRKSYLIKKT